MPETLIILRSQQLGVAVAVVPLLWAAVHVVKSSTSFAGGRWSDRFGPERTMWVGWLCYCRAPGGDGGGALRAQGGGAVPGPGCRGRTHREPGAGAGRAPGRSQAGERAQGL